MAWEGSFKTGSCFPASCKTIPMDLNPMTCSDPTIPHSMLIKTWGLKCQCCSWQFPHSVPSYTELYFWRLFSVTLLKWALTAVLSLCITYPLIQVIYFSTFLFTDSCGIAASPHPWKGLHIPSGVYMLLPDAFPASWWARIYWTFFFHLQKVYTHS